MIDFSTVKLGKKAAKIDVRTLKLARYFTSALPAAPDEVDYTFGITDWGMMLNDQLGDCTIAACGHAEQTWSAARDGEYTLPDSAILQKYQLWCGYDPSAILVGDTVTPYDQSTDNGDAEIDVLNKWRKSGFWKHPLLAYADPAVTNIEEVCQAIDLFGGVYIGVQLPVSVQGKNVWDVSNGPDAVPGSWGGHAVWIPKYRTVAGKKIFTAISWGGLIDITQDFWLYNDPTIVDYGDGTSGPIGPYIDEVHALLAPEFFNLKTGTTPAGLDLDQLEADLQLIAA